jgi:plasmid stability protein
MDTQATQLKGDTKRVTFYLPTALHRRLKVRAAQRDTSATALAARFIDEGLRRDETKSATVHPL